MTKTDPKSDFINLFCSASKKGEFIRMIIGKRANSSIDFTNIYLRPIKIKGELLISFIYRYPTKDITKNYKVDEAAVILSDSIGEKFLHAIIFTQSNDIQLFYNSKKKSRLLFEKPTMKLLQPFTHDHPKYRLIKADNNIYLEKLGVLNSKFEIIPKMQDKYRQINKFIELIDSMLRAQKLPERINITDMGSGKGYLTFALYDHLVNNLKVDASVTGIEIRNDLVEESNKIAKLVGFNNLRFEKSDINTFDASGTDLLIALHACDTATDDAIAKGIIAKSKYIVVAPCCHKQIRKNMAISESLRPVLKHGIFFERQAELLTDALRALFLEFNGYKTKVFEFISSEHTPKNIMITGIKKRQNVNKSAIYQQIQQLKKLYHIEYHYLERLLNSYQHANL